MNWKWIIRLSSFGIVMGLASVMGLTKGIEGWFWLIIGLICAYTLVRFVESRHLLHGFIVGLIGGGVAPLIQAAMFSTYVGNNSAVAEKFGQIQTQTGFEPRMLVLFLTPVIAVVSGAVVGLLTWLLARLFKRRASQASTA